MFFFPPTATRKYGGVYQPLNSMVKINHSRNSTLLAFSSGDPGATNGSLRFLSRHSQSPFPSARKYVCMYVDRIGKYVHMCIFDGNESPRREFVGYTLHKARLMSHRYFIEKVFHPMLLGAVYFSTVLGKYVASGRLDGSKICLTTYLPRAREISRTLERVSGV